MNMFKYLIGFSILFVCSCSSSINQIKHSDNENPNSYKATIYRDIMGVPHIFGIRDADAAYGLAYAHAEDDFLIIQDILLAARGQLASVKGAKAAVNDYYVQLLEIWKDIDNRYKKEVPEDVKLLCDGYASGINDYVKKHPKKAIKSLYPLTGEDILAGFMHRLPLFYGFEKYLINIFKKSKLSRAFSHNNIDPLNIDMIASNVIAVGPERSSDNYTRLLLNTHQPWDGPTSWYEAHVHSEEGWNMVGGLFPGSPVIFVGHNKDIAWSHTVNHPDLVDIYELEMNPENDNQYLMDGNWVDLIEYTSRIKVKLWGPFKWTVKIKSYKSIHGPVIKQDDNTFAIRYSGMNEMRTLEQWYRMNKSQNLNEFKSAMKMMSIPMFNTGYADKFGNIYYLYNAMIPKRIEGYDWKGNLPGNTSKTIWDSYIPFEELPQITNPEGAFYQNCNASPFLATGNINDFSPDKISITAGIETHQTNRSKRALELYGLDKSISKEEFYEYKFDRQYSDKSVMAYAINRYINDVKTDDHELNAAINLLKNWNLRTDIDNKVAALAILTFLPHLKWDINEYKHDVNKITAQLKDTISKLKSTFGRFDVPLGEVQRLKRGDVDLPLDGGPDNLRAIYTRWVDDRMVATNGDCYFQFVEWSPDGTLKSESIHQYGSNNSNPESQFYNNQSKLFSNKKMKTTYMDLDDIKNNLSRSYTISSE